MSVTKGNVAQQIARLEEQGLVQRYKDGRTNYIYLTESGSELIASIMPLQDQRVKEILSLLSKEELAQFQSILRVFDRHLS